MEKTNEYLKEQERQKNNEKNKKGFPDRPLPTTEDGVPIPDTNTPHTQLGIRNGRKGTYGKAREFDADGKPVRDIEFTDHGRPQNHSNPHQHRYQENSKGGSRKRMKTAESVPEWSYE